MTGLSPKPTSVKPPRAFPVGGTAPFGWTYDANRKLVSVPHQQEALAKIRQLRAEGMSLRAISAKLADDCVRLSHVGAQAALAADRAAA